MKRTLRAGLATAAAFGLMLAGTATASASVFGSGYLGGGDTTYSLFRLSELNGTGANGFASVRLDGNEAHVRIYAFGLLPNKPHAQHFHIGGAGRCPTEADAGADGIISTVDGVADYGTVGTSLTTTGDTSPASAVAVKRFPTAEYGFVNYQRTIHVSDDVASDIRNGNAVVVLHGIDTNGNGKYDFSAGKSALNPALPLEATAPAACGNQSLLLSF